MSPRNCRVTPSCSLTIVGSATLRNRFGSTTSFTLTSASSPGLTVMLLGSTVYVAPGMSVIDRYETS